MKKTIVMVLLVIAIASVFSITALAVSYNLVVPGSGGYTYTDSGVKSDITYAVNVCTYKSAASNYLSIRAYEGSTAAGYAYSMPSTGTYHMTYTYNGVADNAHYQGHSIRMRVRSDASEPTTTTVKGNFYP